MENIQTEIIEGGKFISLTWQNYNALVSIDFGASLQHLAFNGQKIVDGITDSNEIAENFHKSYNGAILAPFANRIPSGSFVFEENTYSFPVNNSGENAIHGYVADKPFDVIEIGSNSECSIAILQCEIEPISTFPFRYQCQVKYTLSSSGLLTEIKVKNKTDRAMPCFLGFHPYFCHSSRVNECNLQFWPKEKYVLNNMIPTGEKILYECHLSPLAESQLDDCFTIDKSTDSLTATLTDPLTNLSTNIYTSAEIDHLQIYTPSHRLSVAIEPQMAPANAFNLYPNTFSIAPEGEMKFWCRIEAIFL